ncbi:hypothetical protein LSTR_LSTR013781 [Laodelphax striatellus]|uniref:Reverse transcriptase domain-containing protein n=1 Tax=Laodelphax striatellus TaxID=195883 RepID=A0A482X0K0_LAOST|nr:hypothetical protein LSTR_LSTR013781 [Laodelphax striatellus]
MNRMLQYMAYADDVVLIARNKQTLRDAFKQLNERSAHFGLSINESKTKYLESSRTRQVVERSVILDDYSFERLNSFKYLGSVITDDNNVEADIKAKLAAGNRCYYALSQYLRSKTLSRKIKIEIYNTIIKPVCVYGAETWVLTKKDEDLLNTWERKILRRIYGPVNIDGEWRIRTNQELRDLYKKSQIVDDIKIRRLSWLGHVERMSDMRAVKRVFRGNPGGRRLRGALECVGWRTLKKT